MMNRNDQKKVLNSDASENLEYDVSDEEVPQRVKETEEGLVEFISHDELVAELKYLPKS